MDNFLQDKAALNHKTRREWMKKQQEILQPMLVNPTQSQIQFQPNSQRLSISIPSPARSKSIYRLKSNILDKQVEINTIILSEESSPLLTAAKKANSKSPNKEAKVFDFELVRNNSKKLSLSPNPSPLKPKKPAFASTLCSVDDKPLPAIQTERTVNRPKIHVHNTEPNGVIALNRLSPEECSSPLTPYIKKLKKNQSKESKETSTEYFGAGYVDLFLNRVPKKSKTDLYSSSVKESSQWMEAFPSITHLVSPRGQRLLSRQKLIEMRMTQKSKYHLKGSSPLRNELASATLGKCVSQKFIELSSNLSSLPTETSKDNMSARLPMMKKLVFNMEEVERIDHENVENNKLLSTRSTARKLSKTKHHMFRIFKETN